MERAREATGRYEWMRPLPCLQHHYKSLAQCRECERAFKARAEYEHATGNLLQYQQAELQAGRWSVATEVAHDAARTRLVWLEELCSQWGYAPDEDWPEWDEDQCPSGPVVLFDGAQGTPAQDVQIIHGNDLGDQTVRQHALPLAEAMGPDTQFDFASFGINPDDLMDTTGGAERSDQAASSWEAAPPPAPQGGQERSTAHQGDDTMER